MQRLRKLDSEWKEKANWEFWELLLSFGTRLRLCSLLSLADGASLPISARSSPKRLH